MEKALLNVPYDVKHDHVITYPSLKQHILGCALGLRLRIRHSATLSGLNR